MPWAEFEIQWSAPAESFRDDGPKQKNPFHSSRAGGSCEIVPRFVVAVVAVVTVVARLPGVHEAVTAAAVLGA